jgi:hypothetical protein
LLDKTADELDFREPCLVKHRVELSRCVDAKAEARRGALAMAADQCLGSLDYPGDMIEASAIKQERSLGQLVPLALAEATHQTVAVHNLKHKCAGGP